MTLQFEAAMRSARIVLIAGLLLAGVSCNNDKTVTDIDGNVYHTITIGHQMWTVENLKTTKYNDGSAIPLVEDRTQWSGLATPAYCWDMNDSSNKNKYGALYNWYAVNTKKLAPAGWHVSTDAEWDILKKFLTDNGYNWNGEKGGNAIAKSLAAKTDWDSSDNAGAIGNDFTKNNRSGFSALPGDWRDVDGIFGGQSGSIGSWWSATEFSETDACKRCLWESSEEIITFIPDKKTGCSVRLLRD